MSDTRDEIVDRVLEGLGRAEVPAHLEQRVLAAIQSRAESKLHSGTRRWKFASITVGATLAAACFLVVATHHSVSSHRHTELATTNPRHELQLKAVTDGATALPLGNPSRRRKPVPQYAPTPRNRLDAVSFPAPPLPLTDQEKLLLRLTRKGDPVEVAMLDPAQRNARYDEERAQVQQFFATSTQEIPSEP